MEKVRTFATLSKGRVIQINDILRKTFENLWKLKIYVVYLHSPFGFY